MCATWVGNDDNSETVKVTGGWVPALMWKEFMTMATQKMPAQDFPRPKGLISVKIDWLTGKLATQFSPKEYVYLEKFWAGKEPKEYDTADDGFWDKTIKKDNNEETLLQFFDNG